MKGSFHQDMDKARASQKRDQQSTLSLARGVLKELVWMQDNDVADCYATSEAIAKQKVLIRRLQVIHNNII